MARGDINVYAAGRNEARAKARFAEYAGNPHFHFFKYDVSTPLTSSDVSTPLSCADVESFHYIIHAASDASPAAFAYSTVEVMKYNIYGTANLLDYGLSHGMRRFLYVSTGEVYGEGGATE